MSDHLGRLRVRLAMLECSVYWRQIDNDKLAHRAVEKVSHFETPTAEEYGAWWFWWASKRVAGWARRSKPCA